jgi:hypothetical protein
MEGTEIGCYRNGRLVAHWEWSNLFVAGSSDGSGDIA